MTLTEHEKQLIQSSFAQIAPHTDLAAELFYGRLFEIAPDTQGLFAHVDMRLQGRKLMQTLAMAVGAIHHLETLIPAVEALGQRHIQYGVQKEQYAVVGEALVWTLEKALAEDFTPTVKSAWVKVYAMLAEAATRVYDEEPLKESIL